MSRKVYIHATGIVSALGARPAGQGLGPLGDRLRAVEPDYTKVVDPKLARRMSRIIKMGVAAAMECLDGAIRTSFR